MLIIILYIIFYNIKPLNDAEISVSLHYEYNVFVFGAYQENRFSKAACCISKAKIHEISLISNDFFNYTVKVSDTP